MCRPVRVSGGQDLLSAGRHRWLHRYRWFVGRVHASHMPRVCGAFILDPPDRRSGLSGPSGRSPRPAHAPDPGAAVCLGRAGSAG